MELSEDQYREIENNLIKLCNTVAIPRFIKALRTAVDFGMFDSNIKGVEISIEDFNQEFVDWLSYGNLNTNFETKCLNDYPKTRQIEDWEEGVTRDSNGHAVREISDEDIPF